MRNGIQLIIVVLFIGTLASRALALVDEWNTPQNTLAEPQLRWDNIESAPFWVGGVKPVFDLWQSRHLVTLEPGQDVTVRLPAHEVLRLQVTDQSLLVGDVQVELSNGSGCFLGTELIPSESGDALLAAPDAAFPQLARITNVRMDQALAIGIFVSRHLKSPDLFPYRDLVDLTAPTRPRVVLENRGHGEAEDYWPMRPGVAIRTQLVGGRRYALETRFAYPLTESQLPQSHFVTIVVNGSHWTDLEYVTSAESANVIFIDQVPHAVGRLERAFFDLPVTHQSLEVELIPVVPLIGRLLELESTGYLFPDVNAPDAFPQSQRFFMKGPTPTVWGLTESHVRDVLTTGASDPLEAERVALRLVRDNTRKDGALLATMLLRREAAKRRDERDLRRLAKAIRGNHTFYRDVLPDTMTSSQPQEYAYFRTCELKAIDRPQAWRLGASQHTFALAQRLPGASFNTLPRDHEGIVYSIGEQTSPTELRLIISQETLPQSIQLAIQLDDGPFIPLAVEPERRLPEADFAPNQGELGMEMLRRRFQGHHHDTLDVPFSQERRPGRLIRACYVEIPIAARIHQIRVVSMAGKGEGVDLRVALQVRAAKPFQLSETEYDGIVRRLRCTPYELLARHLNEPDWLPCERPERELINHWQPLVRYLRSRYDRVAASISRWTPLQWDGPLPSETPPESSELRLRWLSIQIALSESLEQRYTWEIQRAELLQELGETFLAERQLRGLLLFAEEDATRIRAAYLLASHYQSQGDQDALDTLFAARCIRDPSFETMTQLAQHLAQMGEWELSLNVNLVLPPANRLHEAMLESSLSLRRWACFEDARRRLPDGQQQILWDAHRAWVQGRQRDAMQLYRVAGTKGRNLLRYLRESWQARSQLIKGEENQKASAVLAWAQLERQLPGRKTWQRDDSLIKEYDRGYTLESIERNTFYRGFTSGASKPVILRFTGPLDLELECRPVHEHEDSEPIDGWLRVEERGDQPRLHTLPVMGNRPTAGLRIAGGSTVKLGRKVSRQMSFGLGHHEIVISSREFDVVVSIAVAMPAMRISFLPPIGDETMRALAQPTDVQRRRLSWRTPELKVIWSDGAIDSQLTALHDYHSYLCSAWDPQGAQQLVGLRREMQTQVRLSHEEGSVDDERARLLAEGRLVDALALPWTPNDLVAVARRAELYKWIADEEPDRAMLMMVYLSELQTNHPQVEQIRSIQSSLGRAFAWEGIHSVESSWGSRDVVVTGWQPEVPSLLRRSALTGAVLDDEDVATSGEELSVVVTLPDPAEVEVEARLLDMPYLTENPVDTVIETPDGISHRIQLQVGKAPVKLTLSVPSGKHTIRAYMENGTANQYLALRLTTQSHSQVLAREPIKREKAMSCFIASEDEPVRFAVAGPAWLRIDDWTGGAVITRFEAVLDSMKVMTLTPAAGSDGEGLFRIKRLVYRPFAVDEEPVPVREAVQQPEAVDGPIGALVARPKWHRVALDDQFALGWQENGTPSLTVRAVSRRSTDEDTETLTDTEEFLEFSASFRKYHPQWRSYSFWRHFQRWRNHGGPTVGLENRVDWYPDDRPFHVYLLARLLVQDPNGDHPLSGGDREWSLYGRAGMSVPRRLSPQFYHVPAASIFGRAQSLDDRKDYETRTVDQDIFTPYKADHRYGIQISESLHWKPWQDTELYAGASVGTNEDFKLLKPDHAKVWLGWKQQLGAWHSDLRLRNSHYFADGDRRRGSIRNDLTLALTGDHWFKNQTRLEYGGRLTHYFEDNAKAFSLFLTWHFGEGRAYRDFRPGEIPFKGIRERRVPVEMNNHLYYNHVVPPSK